MITSACSPRCAFPCRVTTPSIPRRLPVRRRRRRSAAARSRGRCESCGRMRKIASYATRDDVRAFIGEMAAEYGFDRASARRACSGQRATSRRSSSRWIARCWSRRSGTSIRGRSSRRSAWRAGVAYWNAHAGDLARAEERYGVPAEIIVAIIGVETFYGRNRGQLSRARRADDARVRLPAARRVLSRRAEAVPAARARARDAAASGEGIVRRRDGRAPVHAGELSHLRRRLRRQRAPGSVAQSGRHRRQRRQLSRAPRLAAGTGPCSCPQRSPKTSATRSCASSTAACPSGAPPRRGPPTA